MPSAHSQPSDALVSPRLLLRTYPPAYLSSTRYLPNWGETGFPPCLRESLSLLSNLFSQRMGIHDITLIIPLDAKEALETALATHPALTSLPGPKPEVLSPEDLEQTSGTAELLALPEVQGAITRDFVVLPCDLVSELDGSKVLQQWLTLNPSSTSSSSSSKQGKKRGGMALYYPTHGREGISSESKKVVDETDFLASVPIASPAVPPPSGSLRSNIEEVVMTMPTDTLNDMLEENNGSLPVRQRLLNKHSNVKMRTKHRDAHVYFFPHWVKSFIAHPANSEKFESLSEDVLGAWAKAGWRPSLASKLGLDEVLTGKRGAEDDDGEVERMGAGFDDAGDEGSMTPARFSELDQQEDDEDGEEEVDVLALSSTKVSVPLRVKQEREAKDFASRVQLESTTSAEPQTKTKPDPKPKAHINVPPLLAYIQPSLPNQPLIRRVDTAPQLASISLYLARLPATSSPMESGVAYNPLAHEHKVHPTATIGPQSRVSEADSLVAENVTIGSRTNIKESVIGANCEIGGMVKLTKCVLMDGVVVGDGVTLTNCIIGKRARIEGLAKVAETVEGGGGEGEAKGKGKGKKRGEDEEERTKLTDCEVAPFFVVEAGTEAKGETLKGFDEEGSLEDEGEGGLEDEEGEEGGFEEE
ncbi:Translation initiation factor eIF-2B subunit gamma [Elasticomyces elasticus]|nr:Translation initiation factor eIF-2B subunit gamma [Elasticomyces elasticus]